jgi:hypothetical protein
MRLPIPDDWDGEYCRYAICWPSSEKWKAVLRGLITQAARGWSWDEKTGDIRATQNIIRDTLDKNLHLEECIMTNCDDNLADIAKALTLIAKSKCCEDVVPADGGIQGTVDVGDGTNVPVWGSVPGVDLPVGEVPPGYGGTFGQYTQDKCNAAHAIVSSQIQTLRNFAYINFLGTAGLIAVVGAAVAGWILLPVFAIPAIIAAAIGLVGLQAGLLALADAIEERRIEIVCILLKNNSTDAIISLIIPLLAGMIALLPVAGPVAAALRLIVAILWNTDTINQLFTMQAGFAGPADCSACIFPYVLHWGETVDEMDFDVFFSVTSVADPTLHPLLQHRVFLDYVNAPCKNNTIRVDSISGQYGAAPGGGNPNGGNISNCANVDVWRYNVQGYGGIVGNWTAERAVLFGYGPFSVTFKVTEV